MDKKLLGLMIIFFLFFTLFATAVILPRNFTSFTQAQTETLPDATNSKILAWPLSNVKADGRSESTITVIIRNSKTKPIEGRNVVLTTSMGAFKEGAVPTNKEGMAVFHLTSNSPGTAQIEATVDSSVKVAQTVTVQFVQ